MTVLAPGVNWVSVPCPHCGIPADVVVELAPVLTVAAGDDATIRLRCKVVPAAHACRQLRLDQAGDDEDDGGQRELDYAERAAGEDR